METQLIIPAFVAGILTFLAPCTLPLVPAYLGFISGVSLRDIDDPTKGQQVRLRIFLNGLFYVLGFSVVFILFGSVFAAGGLALAMYRVWLGRIGGAFVIFFGLYLTGLLDFDFLNGLQKDYQISALRYVKPGSPLSSFVFGATFAFGWTPCVGPVLGSILALAATTGGVAQGAFLLTVFSAGLAIPFLLIALSIGSASNVLTRIAPYLRVVTIVGGIFLIALGVLLLTDSFSIFTSYVYQVFQFLNYGALLKYL